MDKAGLYYSTFDLALFLFPRINSLSLKAFNQRFIQPFDIPCCCCRVLANVPNKREALTMLSMYSIVNEILYSSSHFPLATSVP